MVKSHNRIGEINFNKTGSKMVIIEYKSAHDIVIEFDNGYITKSKYQHFKSGKIKNPYDKIIYGKGYLGEGKYSSKNKKAYNTWKGMLRRSYDPKYHKKNPTYEGCSTVDGWHNFQNFAKWFKNNYYEFGDQTMDLDKDILIKNNKIYSLATCLFVPQSINKLFLKRNSERGLYPIGVSLKRGRGKFRVQTTKGKHLGLFKDPVEAFQVYKEHKESLIKTIANKNKNRIPKILYEAMMKYRIEIDD